MEATAERRFADLAAEESPLMCPFYAHSPWEYLDILDCSGRGWVMSDLKKHLKHHHKNFCPNGCKAFKNEDELENHLATGQTCVQRIPKIEGFNKNTAEVIRGRGHPEGFRDMTRNEEKALGWNRIYQSIFPEIGNMPCPPSPFYHDRLLIHRDGLRRGLTWIRVERGEQEWERTVDAVMAIVFPNTAMAAAAAAPGPSMVASYPGPTMVASYLDSSRGGGDGVDWAEELADPLVGDGEDWEAAMAYNTHGVGYLFGEPTIAPDEMLERLDEAPVNDYVLGVMDNTAPPLYPLMTVQQLEDEYLRRPETPPSTPMADADE